MNKLKGNQPPHTPDFVMNRYHIGFVAIIAIVLAIVMALFN